jgi:ribonuclease BN (tRNA processing enzyme)
VTVVAFAVRHEEMIDSFGYRFETPDRTIVISGDTAPAQTIVDHGRGCDVLIHEAYSMATITRSRRARSGSAGTTTRRPSNWRKSRTP